MASQKRLCKHAPESSCKYVQEAVYNRMLDSRSWMINIVLMVLTLITFGVSSSDSPGWFGSLLVMLLGNLCAISSKKSVDLCARIFWYIDIGLYILLALVAFSGMTDVLYVHEGTIYFIDNEYFHGMVFCHTFIIYLAMLLAFLFEVVVYFFSFLSFRRTEKTTDPITLSR